MIRAQFKNKDYFDQQITFEVSCLQRDICKLATNEMLPSEIKMNYSISIFQRILGILQLKYSRGDTITSMIDDVKQVLHFRKLQKKYADKLSDKDKEYRIQREKMTTGRLWDIYMWLTFALATSMDRHYFNEVFELIGLREKDYLFDSIATKIGDNRTITEKQFDKRTFGKLASLLDLPINKQSIAMNKYLNKWYELYGEKDLHLNSVDGYSGYWCYEAALVTRLWQLDDSGWREHPYYPKDLVR